MFISQGQWDKAVQEYLTALKLKPDYSEAHYNLGLVYKEKGLKSMAIEEFKEALRIKPDYMEARKVLESLSNYKNSI